MSASVFQPTTLCQEGEKKHLKSANFAFADGRNQTRAACAASEWAILYTIASWQEPLRCYFRHHHFVTLAESDITTTSKVTNLGISSYFSYQTNNTERQINVKHWDRPIGAGESGTALSIPIGLSQWRQVKNVARVLLIMITIDSLTLDRIKTRHFVFCLLFYF